MNGVKANPYIVKVHKFPVSYLQIDAQFFMYFFFVGVKCNHLNDCFRDLLRTLVNNNNLYYIIFLYGDTKEKVVKKIKNCMHFIIIYTLNKNDKIVRQI
jgi:hypothetical protein